MSAALTNALLAVIVALFAVLAYRPAQDIMAEWSARVPSIQERCPPPKASDEERPVTTECADHWRATGVWPPKP